MNTLYFKYALEIERTRSITKAADNLYMAQPNLSKAIKELEDTVGFPIFQRSSRGVMPTAQGLTFLAYARTIGEQLEKIDAIAQGDPGQRQHFAVSIPRGSYIATAFTQFAAGLDPEKEISLTVQETNSMQPITDILENRFKLGIIRYQKMYENYFLDYLADKGLCHEHIWEFAYLVLMSRNHALANALEVLYSELSRYIEIVHGDTSVPYLGALETQRAQGPDPVRKRIYLYERCNQFDLLNTLPATYMWVSPIPEPLLERYCLVQRRCNLANNLFKDVLIYPQAYAFSPLDKKFIDHVYASKNALSFPPAVDACGGV
ncbi:MAG: LysR family transcriptional regulator [Spirochaetaceae bacterium]|jgi:DNA-binding transcriptional LysR family regulator|nr:LysR family transcriptional regulator [Spirochaetaceae bacterium]